MVWWSPDARRTGGIESRNLNEHKQNYVTHDLKLITIIHALKMWRHYLLGKRFISMSDHSGLRYVFYQLNPNVRKARWLATPSEFHFNIMYIKGKENRVADALSRRVKGESHFSSELLCDRFT